MNVPRPDERFPQGHAPSTWVVAWAWDGRCIHRQRLPGRDAGIRREADRRALILISDAEVMHVYVGDDERGGKR